MTILDRINAASASARHWLKHTSVQLAWLVAVISAWAEARPDDAAQVKAQALALVPVQYRWLVVLIVVGVIPTWARVRRQGLAPKGDAQ